MSLQELLARHRAITRVSSADSSPAPLPKQQQQELKPPEYAAPKIKVLDPPADYAAPVQASLEMPENQLPKVTITEIDTALRFPEISALNLSEASDNTEITLKQLARSERRYPRLMTEVE